MNKVIWMMLVGLVVTAGSAQANCGHCDKWDAPKVSTEETVTKKLNEMAKDLKLSAEQKAQVQVILNEKLEKKQGIMNEKYAALEALHEDYAAKLKGVLNEKQMKQWETKKDYHGKKDKKCKKEACPHDKAGK